MREFHSSTGTSALSALTAFCFRAVAVVWSGCGRGSELKAGVMTAIGGEWEETTEARKPEASRENSRSRESMKVRIHLIGVKDISLQMDLI
jgi:hypothetical protein